MMGDKMWFWIKVMFFLAYLAATIWTISILYPGFERSFV